MTIGFHDVTPLPLAGTVDHKTDIWMQERTFVPGLKYNVIAPSGRGKSTFMHVMYGLRFDFTGIVRLGDRDVRTVGREAWSVVRKEKLAIVFQDLRLFLKLTASENLAVKEALYKNTDKQKTAAMAERLGVSHVLNKRSETLSYGERQRIAILRALVQPFEWLLLDEPFSHLDLENTSKAAELIGEEVARRNAGLIITSLGANQHFNYNATLLL